MYASTQMLIHRTVSAQAFCKYLKEQYTQKWKFCHNLLPFKLFQTCLSFCLLLNVKFF